MMSDDALRQLMQAIASGDDPAAFALLSASPGLGTAALKSGATREAASDSFLAAIGHYIYAGDTALHVAAAAHRPAVARKLIDLGAPVAARNRRGATPLHYAADGSPGSLRWDPTAQSATIALLIASGADPDAADKSGVTPLHRAVRTRSAAAARALIESGADARRPNGNGSTPIMLATTSTGKSGSGSDEAKAQAAAIVELLGAAS